MIDFLKKIEILSNLSTMSSFQVVICILEEVEKPPMLFSCYISYIYRESPFLMEGGSFLNIKTRMKVVGWLVMRT